MEKPNLKSLFAELPIPFDLFVSLSRDAATCMRTPAFCRLRRCARAGNCDGRLKRRDVPPELSDGEAFSVWLPLCIASADDEWLEAFIAYWHACRDHYFEHPIRPPEAEPQVLPLIAEWPHADACSLETLPSFLNPAG